MERKSTTCGKLILSGEYAVVLGYSGIALPAPVHLSVSFEEDSTLNDIVIEWSDFTQDAQTSEELWREYCHTIVNHCLCRGNIPTGVLQIENTIPLSKGMGSSTALVVGICSCLLEQPEKETVYSIEQALNPKGSGIDFAVIWENTPIVFSAKKTPQRIDIPSNILEGALLIDTGTPNQNTHDLVTWIQKRETSEKEVQDALKVIGRCTEDMVNVLQKSALLTPQELQQSLFPMIHKHHEAQCTLRVVPKHTRDLIKKIEQEGGAAKVIGAGSRSGGGGMVIAFGIEEDALPTTYPTLLL